MPRFDAISRIYDLLWIPTHPEDVREAIGDVEGPALDLGGGTGRFTEAMHPSRTPRIVADRSSGMLQRARRARDRHVEGVKADGARLPFPDGAFPAVTVTEAFHHFAPHQATIVEEIARVIDPEGVFVVEEIDPDHLLGRAIELGENRLLGFGSRFHRPEDLAELLEGSFGQVQTRPTGAFTYLAEARHPIGDGDR